MKHYNIALLVAAHNLLSCTNSPHATLTNEITHEDVQNKGDFTEKSGFSGYEGYSIAPGSNCDIRDIWEIRGTKIQGTLPTTQPDIVIRPAYMGQDDDETRDKYGLWIKEGILTNLKSPSDLYKISDLDNHLAEN